jgi:hypothetical protein
VEDVLGVGNGEGSLASNVLQLSDDDLSELLFRSKGLVDLGEDLFNILGEVFALHGDRALGVGGNGVVSNTAVDANDSEFLACVVEQAHHLLDRAGSK